MPTKTSPGIQEQRQDIDYFQGVNSLVGYNMAKKQELYHAENVRAKDIGIVEKREGTTRLGNPFNALANYDLIYFLNEGVNNSGSYRISTFNGETWPFYLNTATNSWTQVLSSGGPFLEMGDSTTQYNITNVGGNTMRYTYTGVGTNARISFTSRTGASVIISSPNFSSGNNGTFVITGIGANFFEVTNILGVAEAGKLLGSGGFIRIGAAIYSDTIAEQTLFMVNGVSENKQIDKDGVTIQTSTSGTSHLFKSPRARKINYYKDKLYLADYFTQVDNVSPATEYPNGVVMSSVPLGIVALADGDSVANSPTVLVTDTKYIHVGLAYQVWRGDVFIALLSVTGKTETSITVSPFHNAILSSDEIWADQTIFGPKRFQWAERQLSGIDVRQYDTFKLSGDQNDRIRMLTNIGNVMVIANTNNMAVWDNYKLDNLDMGIGCVSDKGFVKASGQLWFLHYTGIYTTSGTAPQLMSSPVDRYIRGATRSGLENACLGRKRFSVFAQIGDVTLYRNDGSVEKTLSDVALEYNLQHKIWFVHTEVPATMFSRYVDSLDSDQLIMATNDVGHNVYKFLDSTQDTVDGTLIQAIHMRMDTARFYLGNKYDLVGTPLEIGVECERGAAIKCFVSLDGEPFYELPGMVQKGIAIIKVTNVNDDMTTPPRCRFLTVSLRDSTGQLVRVGRLFLKYLESSEKEDLRPEGIAEA